MLFATAVALIWVALHTPPLDFGEEVTVEEHEAEAIQTNHACLFAIFSSLMLILLYVFMKYIGPVLEVLIAF